MSKVSYTIWYWDKKEVFLRITKICNQGCYFCFADVDNKTFVSFEDLKKEIDSLIEENSWTTLDFAITWWEPTTHPDFIGILDYIYSRWHVLKIMTNWLYFWNDANFEKIRKYLDKMSFFISFHSNLDKIYSTIVQRQWQFILAEKWIKNILKNTVNFDNEISINIVFNAFNLAHMPSYFKYIGENFYPLNSKLILIFSVMSNVSKHQNIDKIFVRYTDIVEMFNNSKPLIEKYKIKIWSPYGGPCNLPYCVGNKLFFFEINNDSLTRDVNEELTRNEWRDYADRIKLEECKKCKYNDNCFWILSLYVDKFWDEEFKSIQNN